MAAPSILLKAGQETVSGRINVQLAASQTFATNVLVGISNASYGGGAGYALPFSSANNANIAFALGRFDAGANASGGTGYGPVVSPAVDGTDSADVTNGVFKMANGTSGNALTQASIGHVCYTADGRTANKTASTNPLPGSGTGTGKLAGTVVSVNQDGDGFVLVSVVLPVNSILNSLVSSFVAPASTDFVASTSGGSPTTAVVQAASLVGV
jgi:hypothetical protein